MRRAIERGLSTADFENMTVGMIIDYLVTCQNEDLESKNQKNEPVKMATQADIDSF